MAKSIPEIVYLLRSCISWDCWRMRAEARASLLINPRVGFVHTQARISASALQASAIQSQVISRTTR